MTTYRKEEISSTGAVMEDVEPLKAVCEQIPANYGQYLRSMQQRNRRLQELRTEKREAVRNKERKEQGFSLYFSGANSARRRQKSQKPIAAGGSANKQLYKEDEDTPLTTQRKAKTSRGERNSAGVAMSWDQSGGEERRKTAPNTSRKGWGDGGQVRIKTEAHGVLQVKAPYTYSEDFDPYEDDGGLDESTDDADEEEGGKLLVDKVMLSIDDVRQLRQSMMRGSISEMIAEELERAEAEDAAVIEEIEDMLVAEDEDRSKGDTVVLEFPSPPESSVKSLNLQTARMRSSTAALPQNEVSAAVTAVARENNERKATQLVSRTTAFVAECGDQDGASDGERIQCIFDRIKELSNSQQKCLFDLLSNIELNAAESSSKNVTQSSPLQLPMPIPLPATSCVKLELISNWGHPDKIGLTEIQLFDTMGKRIAISSVSCREMEAGPTLDNIYNGKFKTTKERQMWSTVFRPNVTLTILVQFAKSSQINKIMIWNYNKSLQDLDIGVRECQISVENEIVFDADLSRGCGNQVFDYGNVIMMDGTCKLEPNAVSSSSTTRRSPHAVARASKEASDCADLGYVNPVPPKTTIKTVSPASSSGRGATESGSSSSGTHQEPPISGPSFSQLPKSSSDNLLSAAALYKSQEALSAAGGLRDHPSQSMRKSQSSQLNSPRQSLPSSRSPKEKTATASPPVSASMAAAEDVTCSTDDDCLINKLKECKKVRSSKSLRWLKDSSSNNKEVTSVPRDDLLLNENDEAGRLTPMQKITAAREKRRKSKENILEQSWTSLNFFNRSQAGRISLGIEGDSLDQCIVATTDKHAAQVLSNKQLGRHSTVLEEDDDALLNKTLVPLHNDKVEEEFGEEGDSGWSDDDFFIPELPEGSELVINIRSTWGDSHYVGLTGIELFSDTGEPIRVKAIRAEPADINILSGYGKDPRVVTNLTDGVNRTRDDVHMWLTPFTEGSNHWIYISFDRVHRLALLRFWNYNKSRIHSSRGARFIEVSLASRFIFKGDIVRACGVVSDGSCETILFTTDDQILENVSFHDKAFIRLEESSSDEADTERQANERPPTADTSETEASPITNSTTSRPFTCAKMKKSATADKPAASLSSIFNTGVYTIRHLLLNFTASWGDEHYLGLTGLELIDSAGNVIPITIEMLEADPRDMTVLSNCRHDGRTLDKLVNGTTRTTSDEQMWMIPFTEGEDHTLEIRFPQATGVAGLRVWNYNKSPEDAYRGAKVVQVTGDGRTISPPGGYLLRKAPGHCHFDFGQEILFAEVERFESPDSESSLPCGFIYQMNLFCAWNDQYYLGLNGLECYDENRKKLELTKSNIAAFPESTNVLNPQKTGSSLDIRTPDKLIDGIHDTSDGRHMWLAPILPGQLNKLFIIFDYPVSLSMIRLWNYSKTPSRGVKDFSVLVDDLLIYSGNLPVVTSGARGILPTCTGSQPHHTVLFAPSYTSDEGMLGGGRGERNSILQCEAPAQDQDVMLTNDHQIVTHYSKPQLPPDQNLRPTTSVPFYSGHGGGANRHDHRR